MFCCKCTLSIVSSSMIPRRLGSSVRCHSTKWLNSTFSLTLHNDQQVPQTYQLELGEANIPDADPKSPSILAVHPSGSSYKQWSGLSNFIKPGSCSGLFGLNMFGYGLSDRWSNEHRKQRMLDHVSMVTSAATAARPESSWHLIGHSMGAGSVLSTAATQSELSDRLASVTVFEPNLFSLLLVGDAAEQRVLADIDIALKHMMAAASAEDWNMWGKILYRFWFDGKWDSLEEGAKKMLLHTSLPHAVYEFQSLKWAIDEGPELARSMMDRLADLRCKKRMVISAVPGIGSKDSLMALAKLLRREAGFEIIRAPVGGHMGPVTHRDIVLPLLLSK